MTSQQTPSSNAHLQSTVKVKPTPVFGAIALDGETIVSLPFSQLVDSLGKTLYYQHQHQTVPFLCRQSHETSDCRGLHIKPEYLAKLGPTPGQHKPCCAYCDDPFTRSLLSEEDGDAKLQLLGPVFYKGVMYPIERMMITQAIVHIRPWDVVQLQEEENLGSGILKNIVCKDHAQGYCIKGKDCNLLHLCRHRASSAEGSLFTSGPPPWAAGLDHLDAGASDRSTKIRRVPDHHDPVGKPSTALEVTSNDDCPGSATEVEDNDELISNPAGEGGS